MSDPVVVLGMHRSGTSFLVRALNLSGLWLGGDGALSAVEGRAMIGNPKGNYENRTAIAINNGILAKSGGSWFDPPPRLISDEKEIGKIRTFCMNLEQGCAPPHLRWGWKDPRTVLTFDVWLRALHRPIFMVASFRHPTAVAHSLLARDKIPLEFGYALWIYYNSQLLSFLDRFPHVLVRYDVDQEALLDQVVRVCEVTGLNTDRKLLASWYEPKLVRHNAKTEDLPDVPMLAPLWDALLERHRSQCASPTS